MGFREHRGKRSVLGGHGHGVVLIHVERPQLSFELWHKLSVSRALPLGFCNRLQFLHIVVLENILHLRAGLGAAFALQAHIVRNPIFLISYRSFVA